jgi:hypothetical protein
MPIIASKPEALGIIKGWAEDSTPLFFSASTYGLAVEGRAYVESASEEMVMLRSEKHDFFAGFPLSNESVFWYSETREVSTSRILSEAEKTGSGIGISLPSRIPSTSGQSLPEKLILIALAK